MNIKDEREKLLKQKKTIEARIKFHRDVLESYEKVLQECDEGLFLLDRYEEGFKAVANAHQTPKTHLGHELESACALFFREEGNKLFKD